MKITPLVASRFRSDGGSMFGLVPKAIWSKLLPADANNTIAQHANCLLIETEDGLTGLVDTGCGDPAGMDPKSRARHGLEETWSLPRELESRMLSFDTFNFIILTHLHWDHAGGASKADGRLTFPHANVYVHDQEWTDANSRNELLYKSYPESAIAPLHQPRLLRRVTRDQQEIFPGVSLLRSGGHTRGHCCVLIESPRLVIHHPGASNFEGVTRILFTGDACPTRHHMRMVFQTAYDTFPLDTRAWKRRWLTACARDGTAIFYGHDPDIFAARISTDTRYEFRTEAVLETTHV